MKTTISAVAQEAAKCGMSYGKYVATHQNLPKPAPDPNEGKTLITCPHCGKNFFRPIYTPAKHCRRLCDECRADAYARRERLKRERRIG